MWPKNYAVPITYIQRVNINTVCGGIKQANAVFTH